MKDFKEFVRKEFGERVLAETVSISDAISTGSLSLDASIGVGGLPKAKYTEIAGSEGTGKSTIALETARNCLARGERVLYIDPENVMDLNYAKAILGEYFDLNEFLVVQPETGEDSLLIMEQGLIESENQNIGLIVLDSIGALTPRAEKEKDLDDATIGETARLLSRFLRRVSFFVRSHNVAVLFINQVRDNVGGYNRGYVTPGGHALKHMCSVRIRLGKGQKIKNNDTGEIIGTNVPFTIKKNKVAPPYRSFEFPLIFGKGIDKIRDTVEFAKMLSIIETRGPYYKLIDGDTIGLGMENTVQALEEDSELLDTIRERCYNALNPQEVENEVEETEEEAED
jgi:recombination protein RecA